MGVGGGGGRWGWVGSQRWAKENILTQAVVPYPPPPQLVQSTGQPKAAIRSSLVPHVVPLMPLRAEKCILVVQQHR